MANISEIADGLYRITIYVPDPGMQFNHFLVVDDEPLLFHTGYRAFFPELHEAVARILEPAKLRWIGFSHFEPDECGALNHWLEVAPQAQPLCSVVGSIVTVPDFANRPPRGLADGETLSTGKRRFRFCATPHLPHGWDAGLLFEETEQTLLCSDLFFHMGDPEPVTESDIVGRASRGLAQLEAGPLANSVAYTSRTEQMLEGLATLRPRTLATMHGSSFRGDGARALRDLATFFRETLGKP